MNVSILKVGAIFSLTVIIQTRAAGLESQWMFAAGGNSSLTINYGGFMIDWGSNQYGQLGQGDNVNRTLPTYIYYQDQNWVVDISKTHALAIHGGNYFAWGSNQYGELGDGTTNSQSLPYYAYSTDGNWLSVCAGTDHSVGLKGNGTVYTWGRNEDGQLGLGAPSNAVYTTPQYNPNLFAIKAISCGDDFAMALKSDGTLWGWGLNSHGNLGDNTTTNRFTPVAVGTSNGTSGGWVAVSAGVNHTVGLRDGGRAYSFGYNAYGQLGDGTTTQRLSPVQIPMPALNQIVEISAGGSHTLAVTVQGGLWAWGRNNYGQLGDGTNTNRTSPTRINIVSNVDNWIAVQAGDNHSLGLRVDGTLMSWGDNTYGQLGRSTSSPPQNQPGTVLSSMRMGAMGTGYAESYLIKADGSLWAWGSNSEKELGITGSFDNTVPNMVPTTNPSGPNNVWVKLAHNAGQEMMAGIRAGGSLWTWGTELGGELGNGGGSTDAFSIPTRIGTAADTLWKDVDCGFSHCVAVKSNGTLWSWGNTYHGNTGSITIVTTPVQVGSATNWISAAAGEQFTAALNSNGTLFTWGGNNYGQLGIANNYAIHPTPTLVNQRNTSWKDVQCGDAHVLALDGNGQLWAWGSNEGGQLGNGQNGSTFPYTSIMGQVTGASMSWRQFTARGQDAGAVDVGDNLYFWGEQTNGQIGNGLTRGVDPTPTWIENARCGYSGYMHSASIGENIYGWGNDYHGDVGNGTNGNAGVITVPVYVTYP